MAVKSYNPTTASRRNMTVSDFSEITASAPLKSLTVGKHSTGGRNSYGRVTTRFRGAGNKRRYRMIDFVLSSMVNAGIDNVTLVVRKNYLSLLDHLGSGREWDLARKNGGLNIIPPFAQKNVKVYNGRVEALESIKTFLVSQKGGRYGNLSGSVSKIPSSDL